MKSCCKSINGFTLIELMVTIALAALLMMVAVPSFTTFQRNAELTATTNKLVAAINAARGEAMKRGLYAMVVPTDGANWSTGWVVFVGPNVSRPANTKLASDITVLTQETPSTYLTISGGSSAASNPYIMYDASGYSRQKGGGFGALTFTLARNDVSTADQDEQTRRIIIASTGRVRSCKPSTDTTCTSSALQ